MNERFSLFVGAGQCDQIGRIFAIWATLGYFFYLTNYYPNKPFPPVVCLKLYFKVSNVDVLVFQIKV